MAILAKTKDREELKLKQLRSSERLSNYVSHISVLDKVAWKCWRNKQNRFEISLLDSRSLLENFRRIVETFYKNASDFNKWSKNALK